MSARVSGQAAAACAKGSLSGFTHAVSFRAQRSETTGYAAIQSAAERPAMHLSGETIADPPLYIEVWIEADECARQFSRALNVLNIKVFIGIVNRNRLLCAGRVRALYAWRLQAIAWAAQRQSRESMEGKQHTAQKPC